jgi:RES domain-containing protein
MITVYRITACKYIDDLSGEGAYRYGARWNKKGTRILYTAENAALAMLEALAHITMLSVAEPYCMARLSIPESWELVQESDLPSQWKDQPPPDMLASLGTDFVQAAKTLALKVPSVLVPDNFNVLINPLHPLFKEVKVIAVSKVSFDQRLLANG